MRILANYGYKANGDSYSVTFETMGDVPRENADGVVDELFSMAKHAVQRQVNPEADPSLDSARDGLEFPPKEEVVVPKPTRPEQSRREKNGNGRPEGRGLVSDSRSHKPQLKDPEAPATKKQKALIIRLAKERGQFIEGLNDFTMQEASEKIDELMAVAV